MSIQIDVTCTGETGTFAASTRNLTAGGLFLETERPLPPDTRLELVLALPGSGEEVKASGRVVHAVPYVGCEPAGVGVAFTALEETARIRLVAFLERRSRVRGSRRE